jgi:phosphatidylinositol glycan class B
MQRSEKTLFGFGLMLYLLVAWNSEGYHHLDEHFQIIEFANYKLGNIPASDMPWEFGKKIRPSFQPILAMAWIRIANDLSINVFDQMFFLRVLSALLCLWLYWLLCIQLAGDFEKEIFGRRFLFRLSVFLWYMPYISVRFSSETWSALSLLAGTLILLQTKRKEITSTAVQLGLSGFLMGLAFLFRFQIAFAVMGVGAWLLFEKRIQWQQLVAWIFGGLSAVAIGFALDCWFYERTVFTPWLYYKVNIQEGLASEFGVSPWWYYVPEYLLKAIPPLSVALLLLLIAGIRHKPRHIFTWMLLPFLLVHTLVGHKEIRFLFPMAFPALFLMVQGWDAWHLKIQDWKAYTYLRNFLVGINLVILLIICLLPAHKVVGTYHFFHHYVKYTGPVRLYTLDKGPFYYQG